MDGAGWEPNDSKRAAKARGQAGRRHLVPLGGLDVDPPTPGLFQARHNLKLLITAYDLRRLCDDLAHR